MNSNKKTARIVGVLFLAGMVAGITGNVLVQSTLTSPDYLSLISVNSMTIGIGAMLMLMTSVWDATHGILMLPILKQYNERMALGYFGFRIINAGFLGIQVLFILLMIPLGDTYLNAGTSDTFSLQALGTLSIYANLYAYQIAMIFVGLAGMLLCYVFYKAKLVPPFIAIWGIVGYAIMHFGSVMEVLGFNLQLVHTLPGGLWELFIGVWLIVKGFNPSTSQSK